MITAHSGSDGYPDNSLEFIQAMLDAGLEAFEIDVQVDGGGFYLSHDAMEHSTKAVKLSQVFALMTTHPEQKTLINVDCKEGVDGKRVLALARTYGLLERVRLSGTLNLAAYTPEERPLLFYNLENMKEPWPLNTQRLGLIFQQLRSQGVEVIQLYYPLVKPDYLTLLEAQGIKLSVWTPDDFEEINRLLEMGCYNVTTRRAMAYRHHEMTKELTKKGENHEEIS